MQHQKAQQQYIGSHRLVTISLQMTNVITVKVKWQCMRNRNTCELVLIYVCVCLCVCVIAVEIAVIHTKLNEMLNCIVIQ